MSQGYTDPRHPTLAELLQLPRPPWESSRPGPRSREDTSFLLPFLFLSLRLFKSCFGVKCRDERRPLSTSQRRWHCPEPMWQACCQRLMIQKDVSQGPHIHPSLTASRARIQASEEPLGPSGWASGTLWGRGRRMEGKGDGRQSKRAGNTTKPPSEVPGQRTWLDST